MYINEKNNRISNELAEMIEAKAIEVDPLHVDYHNDRKVVIINGFLVNSDTIVDTDFAIQFRDEVYVSREVLTYMSPNSQNPFYEDNVRGWGNQNALMNGIYLKSKSFLKRKQFINTVRLGNFYIDKKVLGQFHRFIEHKEFNNIKLSPSEFPETTKKYLRSEGKSALFDERKEYLLLRSYINKNTVGDNRINYNVIQKQEVTIVARQMGSILSSLDLSSLSSIGQDQPNVSYELIESHDDHVEVDYMDGHSEHVEHIRRQSQVRAYSIFSLLCIPCLLITLTGVPIRQYFSVFAGRLSKKEVITQIRSKNNYSTTFFRIITISFLLIVSFMLSSIASYVMWRCNVLIVRKYYYYCLIGGTLLSGISHFVSVLLLAYRDRGVRYYVIAIITLIIPALVWGGISFSLFGH